MNWTCGIISVREIASCGRGDPPLVQHEAFSAGTRSKDFMRSEDPQGQEDSPYLRVAPLSGHYASSPPTTVRPGCARMLVLRCSNFPREGRRCPSPALQRLLRRRRTPLCHGRTAPEDHSKRAWRATLLKPSTLCIRCRLTRSVIIHSRPLTCPEMT